MMVPEAYLALLSWQKCRVSREDFENLAKKSCQSPEEFVSFVSNLQTKDYLIHNKKWWRQAEQDYKYCYKKAYKITWPGRFDYPTTFFKAFKHPPTLTYLGTPNLHKNHFPITVVGSREASDLTFQWMDFYLSSLVKEKNICLVSGGARGTDQKVHGIAVRSNSPTVCFLPSGLDHFYPSSLYSFKKNILKDGGSFISCFPPSAQMYKSFFHIRNQLMACFSQLVLVVQAQIRSGTMLTAKKALDFGVPVATLPGPVLSSQFTGNLQLLYDGAFVMRDGQDLHSLVDCLSVTTSEQVKSF